MLLAKSVALLMNLLALVPHQPSFGLLEGMVHRVSITPFNSIEHDLKHQTNFFTAPSLAGLLFFRDQQFRLLARVMKKLMIGNFLFAKLCAFICSRMLKLFLLKLLAEVSITCRLIKL